MNRFERLALRLYPRRWRQRYGPELEALIEDANLGWRGVWDVARGGITMRMTPQWGIAVVAALVGAVVGGAIWLNLPGQYESSVTLRLDHGALSSPGSSRPDRLQAAIGAALATSDEKGATTVELGPRGDTFAVVTISHRAADPLRARSRVEALVAAVLDSKAPTADHGRVLVPPATTPHRPPVTPIPVGAAIGLTVGAAALAGRRRQGV